MDDKVICSFCNVHLHNFEEEDIPIFEHFRWSPSCPFILGKKTANIPINEMNTNIIIIYAKILKCIKNSQMCIKNKENDINALKKVYIECTYFLNKK